MKGSIGTLVILACVEVCLGQSGGDFVITGAVIASGGRESSSGVTSLTGTIGQAAAGNTSSGGSFSIQSGFWSSPQLSPTSAAVSVGGVVAMADGRAIRDAQLELLSMDGTRRLARTNAFGFFRFDDVSAGQGYVLSITSKRYSFTPATMFITVKGAISDITFIAELRDQDE